MSTVARKDFTHPLYLSLTPKYAEEKKFRYASYALSILAIGAAAAHYGNSKIGFTLIASGLFIQGHKIIHEVKNKTQNETQKIKHITERVFTLGLIWGLVTSGLNLSIIWKEGKLALNASRNVGDSLKWALKNPQSLPKAWLNNAPAILSRLTSLLFLGYIGVPEALHYIQFTDESFYYSTEFAGKVDRLCRNVLGIWNAAADTSIASLYIAFKNSVFTIYDFYLNSEAASVLPLSLTQAYTAMTRLLVATTRGNYREIFHEWIKSLSNTPAENTIPIAEQKKHGTYEKVKFYVNWSFFHGLNLAFTSARLYQHPYLTSLMFSLALLSPTNFQTPETIRRKWIDAPDFVGLSLKNKIGYIYSRVSDTSLTLDPWNFPAAALNGFYLAETARYSYSRAF